MGPVTGYILGALTVCSALCALYYNGKYRVAHLLAKQLATDNATLEIEYKKSISALQDARTPINVRISDEQAMKMAHTINFAIEQLRKAETVGMN